MLLSKAEKLLKKMLGLQAQFREGQIDAIEAVVEGKRTLVVQRTGWGKSIVYFIATKLLRDQGAGPTILISPLLSLMRNQIESAERIGIKALSINSTNEEEWDEVEKALELGGCDILLVSPERLSNPRFLTGILPSIKDGIGMFVVDEAHCISDWGHDFRPDYRRIVRIVKSLPPNVPILATTATANDRVIHDIEEQLGPNLSILRGGLTRESLQLQIIRLDDQAERLAWLAENLDKMDESGIIYCLTTADCYRVAKWLQRNGFDVLEYHGGLSNELRTEREQKLINNEVKALVATIALGMGFDKPDLGFVIHYQRPGNLVAYYQQIGRAGRALETAYAILLVGTEDDEIQEYFINSAFPSASDMGEILEIIDDSTNGLTINEILPLVNMSKSRVEKCLKMLQIDEAITKQGSKYIRTINPWVPDLERSQHVTDLRKQELQRIKEFVDTEMCLMKFVSQELDDPFANDCGQCENCRDEKFFPDEVTHKVVRLAVQFLQGDTIYIEPRKQWPPGGVGSERGNIPLGERIEPGRALSMYGDAGWGRLVIEDRYEKKHFRDELVDAAVDLIENNWNPEPPPTWVTCVPSRRNSKLVQEFAESVASNYGFLSILH